MISLVESIKAMSPVVIVLMILVFLVLPIIIEIILWRLYALKKADKINVTPAIYAAIALFSTMITCSFILLIVVICNW